MLGSIPWAVRTYGGLQVFMLRFAGWSAAHVAALYAAFVKLQQLFCICSARGQRGNAQACHDAEAEDMMLAAGGTMAGLPCGMLSLL